MTRAAAIAFPITLCLAWWIHVVNRAGNGPGLQLQRVPNNAFFTGAMIGVPYAVFVLVALVVLYVTQVRGGHGSVRSVMLPALARLAATYAAAVLVAVALGELYCLADERAFRRETATFMTTAVPDATTHELPLHSRKRWWPGSSQLLVSPTSR